MLPILPALLLLVLHGPMALQADWAACGTPASWRQGGIDPRLNERISEEQAWAELVLSFAQPGPVSATADYSEPASPVRGALWTPAEPAPLGGSRTRDGPFIG